MMPALARQHRVASIFVSRLLSLNSCQCRSCHGHVTSAESSILRPASDERQLVDHFAESHVMHSAPANDGFALQPCRPHATPPVHSQACKQHVKVPKSQTCKQQSASPDDRSAPMMQAPTTQGLETFGSAVPQTLKPCMRQNALKRSHDAVPCACNADGSASASASNSEDTKCCEALCTLRPSQTPHKCVRSKGKQKSQCAAALESLPQKLSLLHSEHVSLCYATIIGESRAFKYTSFEHLAAVLKVLKEPFGSSEKAGLALAANPRLLLQPIELLEQKLKLMADFGITEKVVRKIWTYNHHTLPRKVESLHKVLSFLKENGLNADALNRVLYRHPGILVRSPEGSMLHILNFLKSIGVSHRDVLRSMWHQPSFLMMSLDRLRAQYEYFKQLGFSENEYAKTICAGLPRYSIERFQTVTKLLKDQGFSDSDVHKLISTQPSILKVTLENLKNKLDFLLCKQKCDTADIVKFPNCLVCSLQDRLIRRFKILEEKGLSKVYRLSTIMACNELKFQGLGKKKRK